MPTKLRSLIGLGALLALLCLVCLTPALPARAGSQSGGAATTLASPPSAGAAPGVAGQTPAQRMRQEGQVMQPASTVRTGNEALQRCGRFQRSIAEQRERARTLLHQWTECERELREMRANSSDSGGSSDRPSSQDHRREMKRQECNRMEHNSQEARERLKRLTDNAYFAGCKDASTPPPRVKRTRQDRDPLAQ